MNGPRAMVLDALAPNRLATHVGLARRIVRARARSAPLVDAIASRLGGDVDLHGFRAKLAMSEMTASRRNATNRILATPAAPAARPPNPKSAAMIAMTKKTTAQCSMLSSFSDRGTQCSVRAKVM